MKVMLDACVLYPTVMREMLIGVAKAGLYTPLWSPRILEEWARAALKVGPGGQEIARGEIALLRANWPKAEIHPRQGDLAQLWLPDPNDIHVLAAAVAGSADMIVTENRADFPRGILAEHGIARQAADPFLLVQYNRDPDAVMAVAQNVCSQAVHLSGQDWTLRGLMKKARLPRLGKALERVS